MPPIIKPPMTTSKRIVNTMIPFSATNKYFAGCPESHNLDSLLRGIVEFPHRGNSLSGQTADNAYFGHGGFG
jgi:hypothetical protein